MRASLLALALGLAGTALLPAHSALAWWDAYGRWHPDYYRPPIAVAPPPVYYSPYGRWVPPHYDRFGRYIPGHYI